MSTRRFRKDSDEWDWFYLDTENDGRKSDKYLEFESPQTTGRSNGGNAGTVTSDFNFERGYGEPERNKVQSEQTERGSFGNEWKPSRSESNLEESGAIRKSSVNNVKVTETKQNGYGHGQSLSKQEWNDIPRNEQMKPMRKRSGFESNNHRLESEVVNRQNVSTESSDRTGWGSTDPPPTKPVDTQPRASTRDIGLSVRTPRESTGTGDMERKEERKVNVDLEIFGNVDHFVIRQLLAMDILGGCGRENSYSVFKKNGGQMLYVSEDSNCACRWFCGPNRWFKLTMFNTQEIPVLHVERAGCRCDWFCCEDACCCLHRMDVMDGKGRQLGVIREKFNLFRTRYEISNADDEVVARIRGPCCECRCCYDMSFAILNKTGEKEIGTIRKMFGGTDRDGLNVDHELFEMECAPTLDNQEKALLLGATFLMIVSNFEMS